MNDFSNVLHHFLFNVNGAYHLLLTNNLICRHPFLKRRQINFVLSLIAAVQNAYLFTEAWVRDINFEEKPVELRFRQAVCPFVLNRILCCHYQEWSLKQMCLTVHGNLPLFHHLKKSCLGFSRRTVDFINQNDIGKHGTLLKFKTGCLLVEHGCADNISRHQVWRKLYTRKV